MKFRFALATAATIALAACGSADDASTEAEAETVEVAADEALSGVDAEAVEDPAAMEADAEAGEDSSTDDPAAIQAAGDNAAATAEAAMDAMAEDLEE